MTRSLLVTPSLSQTAAAAAAGRRKEEEGENSFIFDFLKKRSAPELPRYCVH